MFAKLFGRKPRLDTAKLPGVLLGIIAFRMGGTLRVSEAEMLAMPSLNVKVGVDRNSREFVVSVEPADQLFVLRNRQAGGSK